VLVAAKDPQESFGAGTGIFPSAGVECRLTATGLVFRKFDLAPDTAQNRGRVEPHLGKKLVDKARKEERNLQGHAANFIAIQKRKSQQQGSSSASIK
jgi:hypothetical protein